jgi:hypothetical protein
MLRDHIEIVEQGNGRVRPVRCRWPRRLLTTDCEWFPAMVYRRGAVEGYGPWGVGCEWTGRWR